MNPEERSQPPTMAGSPPVEPSEDLGGSPFQPGLELGCWTLVSLIGEGGAAEVWKAVDEETGRTVALKVLTAPGRPAALRFNREIDLFEKLGGRRVPALLDFEKSRTPWVRWLALEYVDWPDLGDHVKGCGPLVPPALDRFVIESWEAVIVLGQQGIAHRDLSARNLLVDPLGHAMLIDFGTGKDSAVDGLALTTSLPHTFGFAAPEALLRNQPVGRAADIWGWGAVVYYAATGRHIVAPDEYMSVIDDDFVADVSAAPNELRPALSVALRRNPDDRNEAEIDRLVMAIPDVEDLVDDVGEVEAEDAAPGWSDHWFRTAVLTFCLLTAVLVSLALAFAYGRDVWPFEPSGATGSRDSPADTSESTTPTTDTPTTTTTVPPPPPPVRVVSDFPQSHMAVYQGEQPGTTCALALVDLSDSDPSGDILSRITSTSLTTPVPTEAYPEAQKTNGNFRGTGSYVYNSDCSSRSYEPTRWVWQTSYPGSDYLGNEVVDVDPPFDTLPSYDLYLADRSSMYDHRDAGPVRARSVS